MAVTLILKFHHHMTSFICDNKSASADTSTQMPGLQDYSVKTTQVQDLTVEVVGSRGFHDTPSNRSKL